MKRRASLWAVSIAFLCLSGGSVQARELTFEDRVRAQEAIERVYWTHRHSSKEGIAQPAFAHVVSPELLRYKVEDYLKKEKALEADWHRAITPFEIQAEMKRMLRASRRPDVLAETFHALGDDPWLMAECVVGPILVDRRIRRLYEFDDRFHGDLRAHAESVTAQMVTVDDMRRSGGTYTEVTWRRQSENHSPISSQERSVELSDEDWERLQEQIARVLPRRRTLTERSHTPSGAAAWTLQEDRSRAVEISALQEDGAFSVMARIGENAESITTASVVWPKVSFDAWWKTRRASLVSERKPIEYLYEFTLPEDAPCTDDTWTPTDADVPEARMGASSVWTGTEMIVWGGRSTAGVALNSGSRYDPATDAWTSIDAGPSAPTPRHGASAFWTGTEMLVWGGFTQEYYVINSGGRYDPALDRWRPTSITGAIPPARRFYSAVWTGSAMIVWGGEDVGYEDPRGTSPGTGTRYDPVTDTWLAIANGGAPLARVNHAAAWTGTEMMVWGGANHFNVALSTGGLYDPLNNTWRATSTGTNVPSPRQFATALWTGGEVIIWGGYGSANALVGGRYDPSADSWRTTSVAPGSTYVRWGHTAVWTGEEMLIWGGQGPPGHPPVGGGRYDPIADTWRTMSTATGAPTPVWEHTSAWTGHHLIVWGGLNEDKMTKQGGIYDPDTDSWSPTSVGIGVPAPRRGHSAVWTGAEMIVWGGISPTVVFLDTGGRYDPATDSWTPTAISPDIASARWSHTAVWTGREMIVWGGYGEYALNSGARYDPLSDSWTATNLSETTPEPRSEHFAFWTGTEMLVWGGSYHNSGGRYDPVSDTWRPTSLGANVPSGGGYGHSAVWTGGEMIVWGGCGFFGPCPLNSGSRYDPQTDTWTPTSITSNTPSRRYRHASVWTGREMIVWGGNSDIGISNTGGRYDPQLDIWRPTNTGPGTPSARSNPWIHWTGSEVIVWGGDIGGAAREGGRYDLVSDTWRPVSFSQGVPIPWAENTAVWAEGEMIVWGGSDDPSGARYCAQSSCPVTTWYHDGDGDGWGQPTNTVRGCVQPHGYVGLVEDCDDAAPGVHPGAPLSCSGGDNNCDGTADVGGSDADADQVCDVEDNCPTTANTDQADTEHEQVERLQWAISALASSEYSSTMNSAAQATGPPDTFTCEDLPTAWAPATPDLEDEWIELRYDPPVHAAGIEVRETYIGGFIIIVQLIDTAGNYHLVWTGQDMTVCPGSFIQQWDVTSYEVSGVRIATFAPDFEEIDAVALLAVDTLPPDGIGDACDNCPTLFNPDQQDSNIDGIGDACQCLNVECLPLDACHLTGSCDGATGCSNPPAPSGSACSDDNLCTQGDRCDGDGSCVGTPISKALCNDHNACTADFCNPDVGCMQAPIICNDHDRSTIDTCDPRRGCVFTPRHVAPLSEPTGVQIGLE